MSVFNSHLACLGSDLPSSFGRDRTQVEHVNPVTVMKQKGAGRPFKHVDGDFLQEAFAPGRQISISALAKALGIHRNTLSSYMKIHGVSRKFSDLSDADLDTLVKSFKEQRPGSGLSYLVGFLRRHGLRVQKARVTQSLRRIDVLGRILRQKDAINRRRYVSARPNCIWHCDGHHKLIRWGIVIHGFIDGFCRTVSPLFLNLLSLIQLV